MAKIEDRHRTFMVDGRPLHDRGDGARLIRGRAQIHRWVVGFRSGRSMPPALRDVLHDIAPRSGCLATAMARRDPWRRWSRRTGGTLAFDEGGWPRSTRCSKTVRMRQHPGFEIIKKSRRLLPARIPRCCRAFLSLARRAGPARRGVQPIGRARTCQRAGRRLA